MKGNALGSESTESVFGRQLHSYVITDAIRDEKVLKFKVDYNDVRPQFKAVEAEQDEKKLSAAENRQALLHPERIREITQYILNQFRQKTHRLNAGGKGFNAMFAVSSVDAAKCYYEAFKTQQAGSLNPLKVATIFPLRPTKSKMPSVKLSMKPLNRKRWTAARKNFCRLPSTITTPVSKPISARTAKPFRTTTAIWQNG